MNTFVEPPAFRDAVSRLSAAINVVTSDGPGGLAGFTASAVCSLSDSPPMLLVCLQKKSSAYDAIKTNRVVCINTMGFDGLDLCQRFSAKMLMAQRFDQLDWEASATGSPILANALVSFDCKVIEFKSVATHDILICQVEELREGDRQQAALVYYNRQFHSLATEQLVL